MVVQQGRTRLWLLMRVFHNDTTCLMHLLYKDLQKYTNRGDALSRVLALMACGKRQEEVGLYFTKPWQHVFPKAANLSKQHLTENDGEPAHLKCFL